MSADWCLLSRQARLRVEENCIVVELPAGRAQRVRVRVDEAGDGFSLTSRIAPRRIVGRLMPQLAVRILEQNRLSELVGYRIDRRGRLVGESWVPAAGLEPDEWGFYVRTLATACDRLEFVLTGSDIS